MWKPGDGSMSFRTTCIKCGGRAQRVTTFPKSSENDGYGHGFRTAKCPLMTQSGHPQRLLSAAR